MENQPIKNANRSEKNSVEPLENGSQVVVEPEP